MVCAAGLRLERSATGVAQLASEDQYIEDGGSRAANVGAFLLGAGLGLSTASQLRLPGLPVGVGEILLLCAVGWSLLGLALSCRVRVPACAVPVVQIWALLLVALLGGWVVGLLTRRWNPTTGTYDAFAYAFLMVVISTFLVLPRLRSRLTYAIKVMTFVVSIGLGALLVLSPVTNSLIVTPWVGIRFVGWAENPNQTAFVIGSIPFVAYHFRTVATTSMQRMNATLLMGLAIAVGLATVSDALIVGWLAAGSAIVLIWILGTGTGALFSHRVLLKLFLLGLLLLALGVAFFATIQSGFLSMMSAEQGQAQVRIALWQHGIQVFLDSPIVGYGPGSYSWIRYPHARTEAHNTFIDLAASGGLVALVPFLLLMGAAIRRAFRAREAGLFGCIVYLVVFSSFHFMARHPLFWFLIFFVFLTPGQDGQKKFVIA